MTTTCRGRLDFRREVDNLFEYLYISFCNCYTSIFSRNAIIVLIDLDFNSGPWLDLWEFLGALLCNGEIWNGIVH